MTGWTFEQIRTMTVRQLQFVTRKRGRILYPRLKPLLDANFANVSGEKGANGEPSGVDKIIDAYEREQAGQTVELTSSEERRARAYRIQHREYLGDPDEGQRGTAQPLPGVHPATARAVIAFVKAGGLPEEIFARDVAPLWRALNATAAQTRHS